jgi:hypothetical protein
MRKIVLNQVRTPDGTVLTSRHRHDYVRHLDKNGLEYSVDGGLDYLSRGFDRDDPHEELSVYADESFDLVRASLAWGTRGITGDQPIRWVTVDTLETEHIQNILRTQHQIPGYIREIFEREISYRSEVLQDKK